MQLERVCSTEILTITLTLLWVFLFLFAVFQIENLRSFNSIKRVGVEVECFISLKIVLHFRHSLAVFTSKLLKTSRSCAAQKPRHSTLSMWHIRLWVGVVFFVVFVRCGLCATEHHQC